LAYNTRNGKNGWTLFLLLLAGIVIGGLIGELASGVPFLTWLNLGYTFGLEDAVSLDLKIITLLFKITFDITVASILGIAIAIFTYSRL
jgi:hypothetical protein